MSRNTLRIKRTSDEHLAYVMKEYQAAHPGQPFTMLQLADWAESTGQCDLPKVDRRKELAKQFARVAKSLKHRDPQGRTVRSMLAAKFERVVASGQKVFDVVWDHVNTMSDDHFRVAITQRHMQWTGFGKSITNEIDTYYDNNPNAGSERIQLEFNLALVPADSEKQEVDVIPIDAATNIDLVKKNAR